MEDLKRIVSEFCGENNLEICLSYDMPDGYETAYGTFDVTIKTLFLNRNLLETAPKHEVLFYLYHELRHAMQYLHPQQFDKSIQESRFYVVLYNGICFKLVGNDWKECRLVGEEDYFTEAYLSLPYEIDANTFAYEKVKELCGDSERLQGLYGFCIPQKRWSYAELKALFERIDESLSESLQKGTTLIKAETKRMIIRDFAPEDVADLHEILGDEETMANCERAYDFEKTKRFLAAFCMERKGALAAVHKESGKVIAYILFNEIEKGVYEMGWFLNRSFWRQGYAYEACKAVIDHAFGELKAHKIFAETTDAVKSVGLMKKLGMQLESVQKSQTKDQCGVDLHFYSLSKKDWRK